MRASFTSHAACSTSPGACHTSAPNRRHKRGCTGRERACRRAACWPATSTPWRTQQTSKDGFQGRGSGSNNCPVPAAALPSLHRLRKHGALMPTSPPVGTAAAACGSRWSLEHEHSQFVLPCRPPPPALPTCAGTATAACGSRWRKTSSCPTCPRSGWRRCRRTPCSSASPYTAVSFCLSVSVFILILRCRPCLTACPADLAKSACCAGLVPCPSIPHRLSAPSSLPPCRQPAAGPGVVHRRAVLPPGPDRDQEPGAGGGSLVWI